jgi:beta-galactosidase
MWAQEKWTSVGLGQLTPAVTAFNATSTAPDNVRVTAVIRYTGTQGFVAVHTVAYTVRGDATLAVDNDVQFVAPAKGFSLGRIGVRLNLDRRLATLDYFGRGPMENYSDRLRGADVGRWTIPVATQYQYEKPMEYGNRQDVSWAVLRGEGLPGLLAQADGDTLQVAATGWTDEVMDPVPYRVDLPPSNATTLI